MLSKSALSLVRPRFGVKIIWIPLCLFIMACEEPQRSIEVNIQKLKNAEAKLLQNPGDRQALDFIVNQLHDSKGIYRANAASILGDAGSHIGSSIKDRAVPALSELLDKGDAYDKRAAAEALAQFGPYAQAAVPVLKKNLKTARRKHFRYVQSCSRKFWMFSVLGVIAVILLYPFETTVVPEWKTKIVD